MRRHTLLTLSAVLTAAIIATATIVFAAATGKISGTITDKDTGDPVIGASVLVVGTSRGAITDLDGKYTITMVEPGTYTLRITHVEYQTVQVESVHVKADITTEQSLAMTPLKTQLQEPIKVIGKQDKLKSYEVANQSTITKEATKHKPVTTNPQRYPHIRGGRAGEVSYIVDGVLEDRTRYCPPYAPEPGSWPDAMYFEDYGLNPFVVTEDDPLSTFAVDVDDASYVLARSYLERGLLPPDEAVRVEEFVNHFDYDYPAPRHKPFAIYVDGSPSYFGDGLRMIRIGIKGEEKQFERRRPVNLVFVIDVSGSMSRDGRLELVKRGLRDLLAQLRSNDRVGIVAYNTRAWNVLPPTSVRQRHRIEEAVQRLHWGGSTNAEAGLQLGFRMANEMFDRRAANRVILCSDGVANVGNTDPEQLLRRIEQYSNNGIPLTTIGVGMGNYNDVLLEKLGNRGNGSYHYINDTEEAHRVFCENLGGMLNTIARDVKIQVDFNPEVVRAYRLVGYENRDVADHKFRDDRADGGEVGSGHEVTALYEVELWNKRSRDDRLATVFVRYKDPTSGYTPRVRHPGHDRAHEVSFSINRRDLARRFADAAPDFRLAAASAEFSEILRRSYYAKDGSLWRVEQVVHDLLRDAHYDDDESGPRLEEVRELARLIRTARDLGADAFAGR